MNKTNRLLRVPIVIAAMMATGVFSSCSGGGGESTPTTVLAPAPTTVTTSLPSPPVSVVATTAPPVSSPVVTSVQAESGGSSTSNPTGSSVPSDSSPSDAAPTDTTPADGTVVYSVASDGTSDTKVLEVQETPDETTFVVRDSSDNVIYFEQFDNSDPAFNELFETPPNGGAADTQLVLRDAAGVEVFRVLLTELAAARIAVGQAP